MTSTSSRDSAIDRRGRALARGMTALMWGVLLMVTAASQRHAAAEERFKPFKMRTPDGLQKSLSDVMGKCTLVVFFFPHCPFCNAALPEVGKLSDKYSGEGLSTVWINVVPEEEVFIQQWRERHGFTGLILLGGRSVQNDYSVTMTPTHYLLDSSGKVLSRHAGYQPGDEEKLERQIRTALSLDYQAQPPR